MKKYRHYLTHQKRFTKRTIEDYERKVKQFHSWNKQHDNTLKCIDHLVVMEYVEHLQRRKISSSVINNHLTAITHWFEYLKQEKKVKLNPVKGIKIKGEKKKVLIETLSAEELDELYEKFTTYKPKRKQKGSEKAHLRDTVVLGLLVYQGITTIELQHQLLEDIDLIKGVITIRASNKSNERTLKLEGKQIVPMMTWMNQQPGEYLLDRKAKDLLLDLFKKLRRIGYEVNNQQIRRSVVINWLKRYNIVEVKYMAGHRYISTTEGYKKSIIDDLQKNVMRFHPMGDSVV